MKGVELCWPRLGVGGGRYIKVGIPGGRSLGGIYMCACVVFVCLYIALGVRFFTDSGPFTWFH